MEKYVHTRNNVELLSYPDLKQWHYDLPMACAARQRYCVPASPWGQERAVSLRHKVGADNFFQFEAPV